MPYPIMPPSPLGMNNPFMGAMAKNMADVAFSGAKKMLGAAQTQAKKNKAEKEKEKKKSEQQKKSEEKPKSEDKPKEENEAKDKKD